MFAMCCEITSRLAIKARSAATGPTRDPFSIGFKLPECDGLALPGAARLASRSPLTRLAVTHFLCSAVQAFKVVSNHRWLKLPPPPRPRGGQKGGGGGGWGGVCGAPNGVVTRQIFPGPKEVIPFPALERRTQGAARMRHDDGAVRGGSDGPAGRAGQGYMAKAARTQARRRRGRGRRRRSRAEEQERSSSSSSSRRAGPSFFYNADSAAGAAAIYSFMKKTARGKARGAAVKPPTSSICPTCWSTFRRRRPRARFLQAKIVLEVTDQRSRTSIKR